ncbi:tyrosine-type recombinase/integrase [Hydrogenophaga defluvii]|uniref:Tyrosine-type recombinase/integrase n=1 Tax=Hydrogenophaga defluvii TaxID=249410 RepID=A0ABW2S7Y0_9BURK
MSRPKKTDPVNLAERVNLTNGIIERLTCRTDVKAQAFLRDSEAPGLRVRVTNTGAKSFVFESKLNRDTVRITIGDVKSWTIDQARSEARRLAVMLDAGVDPREQVRQQLADRLAKKEAAAAQEEADKVSALTVGEIWSVYVEVRRAHWGDLHYKDHLRLARPGGAKAIRGTHGRGVTIDMPLYPLMNKTLRDLDASTVEAWAAEQAKTRPTSARLAWRLLKVFLNWCAEQPQYTHLMPARNAAGTRKSREALGRAKPKTGALLREQLPAWFAAVRGLRNPTVAAYLQIMLLTGARPTETLMMRWEDINFRWRSITLRDKVEGDRVIPLTPFVHQLISTLPRRNGWVFASTRYLAADPKNIKRRERRALAQGKNATAEMIVQTSASGHITDPGSSHAQACRTAGISHLSLHDLRRSFKSLTEWLECPAGVVAQIMGHKPTATAEKHYTVRPLDLLRIHHERIEAWVLEQAGISFERPHANAQPIHTTA